MSILKTSIVAVFCATAACGFGVASTEPDYNFQFVDAASASPTGDFGYAWVCGNVPNARLVNRPPIDRERFGEVFIVGQNTNAPFIYQIASANSNCSLVFQSNSEETRTAGFTSPPIPSSYDVLGSIPPRLHRRARDFVKAACASDQHPLELNCLPLEENRNAEPEILHVLSPKQLNLTQSFYTSRDQPQSLILIQGALLSVDYDWILPDGTRREAPWVITIDPDE
ncbi:MAG: hypothetical protein ABJO29_11590 [Yoonia sp.]|uniref:hypothetical protein n=1 Tax=Yoonia sp. TaxID=2212373 RepID=UPI003265DE65